MIGLTPAQARALHVLQLCVARGDSMTLGALSAALGLARKSAVLGILRALEDRGRIRRIRASAPPGCRAGVSIEILAPLPVSRAPDGAPLFLAPMPEIKPCPAASAA